MTILAPSLRNPRLITSGISTAGRAQFGARLPALLPARTPLAVDLPRIPDVEVVKFIVVGVVVMLLADWTGLDVVVIDWWVGW